MFMKMFMINFSFLLTIILIFIKNPLNMGFLIIIQTLIFCLLMNLNLNIYWISYIMYLIMLGGILILFMYMCSISSNEIIKFNINLFIYMLIMFWINIYWMMKINWISKFSMINNYLETFFFNNNHMIYISKMYNKFTMIITLMLIIYLLISMTMVTTITNNNKLPLRSTK